MSAIHYYLTFNPYLNQEYENDYTQAHEFYDFLKDLVQKDKKASAYWGKIIGKDRESSLDLKSFTSVLKQNTEANLSTHLYITDFKNIWVGKVKSVSKDIPKNGNTLSFYTEKKVEVWFELTDFMLLEHSNQETANKLSELYIENDYQEQVIQGLSPFTTGVKYPCFIQDIAEEQYFDNMDTRETSHMILKMNPAITKSNSGQVLKSLHTYVFPEEMYSKLPHAARLEIEAAEADMLEQRHHNMHRIAFSYLKALEIILNDLVVHHIKKSGFGDHFYVDTDSAPPKLHLEHTKDYFIPLKRFNKNFSISHLLYFVERASNNNHFGFKKAFGQNKQFIRYLTKEFALVVRENKLIEIRNALAHGENDKVTFADASAIRNIILGCGTLGLIQMCYRIFYKDKFQQLYRVSEFDKKPTEASAKNSTKKNVRTQLKLVS